MDCLITSGSASANGTRFDPDPDIAKLANAANDPSESAFLSTIKIDPLKVETSLPGKAINTAKSPELMVHLQAGAAEVMLQLKGTAKIVDDDMINLPEGSAHGVEVGISGAKVLHVITRGHKAPVFSVSGASNEKVAAQLSLARLTDANEGYTASSTVVHGVMEGVLTVECQVGTVPVPQATGLEMLVAEGAGAAKSELSNSTQKSKRDKTSQSRGWGVRKLVQVAGVIAVVSAVISGNDMTIPGGATVSAAFIENFVEHLNEEEDGIAQGFQVAELLEEEKNVISHLRTHSREAVNTQKDRLNLLTQFHNNVIESESVHETSDTHGLLHKGITASSIKFVRRDDDKKFPNETNMQKALRLHGGQLLVTNPSTDTTTSEIMQQTSDISRELKNRASVSDSVAVISSAKSLIEDPTKEKAFDVLGSAAVIVGTYVPPPLGVGLGIAMGGLAVVLGSQKSDEEVLLDKIVDSLNGMEDRLGSKLDSITESLQVLSVSMSVVTMLTQYSILVIEKVYQKLWVDPFHNIHAAYMNLMETYFPRSPSDSWDLFYERASHLRVEFEAEVYDAFAYDNIRGYLEWFEKSSINDSMLCGQAMLFQYLMTVRTELFYISEFGSHVRNGDSWELNLELVTRYATKFKKQISEYQMMLTALSGGGLGISDLAQMKIPELLNAIRLAQPGVGICFRCDYDYENTDTAENTDNTMDHCKGKNYNAPPYPTEDAPANRPWNNDWPSDVPNVSWNNVNYAVCNSKTFSFDWYNYQFDLPDQIATVVGRRENMACCGCSCISTGFDGKYHGTAADHKLYGRHCSLTQADLFDQMYSFEMVADNKDCGISEWLHPLVSPSVLACAKLCKISNRKSWGFVWELGRCKCAAKDCLQTDDGDLAVFKYTPANVGWFYGNNDQSCDDVCAEQGTACTEKSRTKQTLLSRKTSDLAYEQAKVQCAGYHKRDNFNYEQAPYTWRTDEGLQCSYPDGEVVADDADAIATGRLLRPPATEAVSGTELKAPVATRPVPVLKEYGSAATARAGRARSPSSPSSRRRLPGPRPQPGVSTCDTKKVDRKRLCFCDCLDGFCPGMPPTYFIENPNSGKVLSIKSCTDRNVVLKTKDLLDDTQRWKKISAPNGNYIILPLGCPDVFGDTALLWSNPSNGCGGITGEGGRPTQVYRRATASEYWGSSQHWTINKRSLRSAWCTNFVIGIFGSPVDGAKVGMKQSTVGSEMVSEDQWRFVL